ncbi:MAG: DEAD/DEAH box helicase [Actinomycetota bacterium]|nr:DEAD/DEAH box helicase [Actinomycetota bacterium]
MLDDGEPLRFAPAWPALASTFALGSSSGDEADEHHLPLPDALAALRSVPEDGPLHPTVAVWATAVRVVDRLIAEGRLRAGEPTDSEAVAWLAQVRDLLNRHGGRGAARDLACLAAGIEAAAAERPATRQAGSDDGPDERPRATLVLLVGEPVHRADTWTIEAAVASPFDTDTVVPVRELRTCSSRVRALLGPSPQADVRRGLRSVGAAWPELGEALLSPPVALQDADLRRLLDGDGVGAEVRWPVSVSTDRLGVEVTTAPLPTDGLALDDWLDLRLVARIGGATTTLDRSLAERLGDPLVRIDDRWHRPDPSAVAAVAGRRRVRVSEAIAAGLDAEPIDATLHRSVTQLVERLRASPRELDPPPGLDATLRHYQRTGLAWLAELSALGLGGVLADDMGLGKTIQVLALHRHRRTEGVPGATLVVCPTSVLGNWAAEARRFLPGTIVHRYHGKGRSLRTVQDGDLVLTTYGVARTDAERLAGIGWDVVVADEAQAIKQPRSATARAMREIPARARFALTGTPVENRLRDLWAVLDWATPGLLGTADDFAVRVAGPIERRKDRRVLTRFQANIGPFVLRRTKTDPTIAPELPPRTQLDQIVELTAEQRRLYDGVVDEALERISAAQGIERRGLVLQLLTRLKQVCNHPAHLLGDEDRRPTRSAKLAMLDDLLDSAESSGESMLVFSQYTTMLDLLAGHLADRGTGHALLTGSVSATGRERLVADFQARRTPVLLVSLRAGGTGLNLTAATQVVHYDRWWNPAVEDQASDRAWRIGQTKPVTVHRLRCADTLEVRIDELLRAKRDLADAVVGEGETFLSELTDDELAELVLRRPPPRHRKRHLALVS